MKTLLIFPKRNPLTDEVEPAKTPVPPLGICYIGAVLEEANMPVELLDCTIAPKDEIVAAIERSDIVGISAPTFFAKSVLTLATYAKGLDKIVIVGGPHATMFPEFFLKSRNVDFVVRGEGEHTFLELIQKLSNGDDWSEVKNISYMRENSVIHNPKRPLLQNLDALPFPARHLLPMDEYIRRWRKNTGRVNLPIFTSRGCPYECIFCAKEIFGKIYRTRSSKNVVDEMELLIDKYRVEEIFFNDDIFTLNKKHVLQICNEIRDRGLCVDWSCEARVNSIDYELLKTMKDAGCKTISYGIESGSQRILDFLNKKTTVAQIERAVHLTKKAGLFIYFFIIIGTPGETKEDINLTKKLIFKTKPDFIKITFFTPLPGTKAFELLKDRLLDDSSFAYDQGLNFRREYFSDEELKSIQLDIMREFRNKLILRNIISPKSLIYGVRNFREVSSRLRKLTSSDF